MKSREPAGTARAQPQRHPTDSQGPGLALAHPRQGSEPQETQKAGTKRQFPPWDLVSGSQLSSGKDGTREMGFLGSGSDDSPSALWRTSWAGSPSAGRWSGTSQDTRAMQEAPGCARILVAWQGQGPALGYQAHSSGRASRRKCSSH